MVQGSPKNEDGLDEMHNSIKVETEAMDVALPLNVITIAPEPAPPDITQLPSDNETAASAVSHKPSHCPPYTVTNDSRHPGIDKAKSFTRPFSQPNDPSDTEYQKIVNKELLHALTTTRDDCSREHIGLMYTHLSGHRVHKLYMCNFCEYSNKDMQKLSEHVTAKHCVQCAYCTHVSLTRGAYLEHMIQMHPADLTGVELLTWRDNAIW